MLLITRWRVDVIVYSNDADVKFSTFKRTTVRWVFVRPKKKNKFVRRHEYLTRSPKRVTYRLVNYSAFKSHTITLYVISSFFFFFIFGLRYLHVLFSESVPLRRLCYRRWVYSQPGDQRGGGIEGPRSLKTHLKTVSFITFVYQKYATTLEFESITFTRWTVNLPTCLCCSKKLYFSLMKMYKNKGVSFDRINEYLLIVLIYSSFFMQRKTYLV